MKSFFIRAEPSRFDVIVKCFQEYSDGTLVPTGEFLLFDVSMSECYKYIRLLRRFKNTYFEIKRIKDEDEW